MKRTLFALALTAGLFGGGEVVADTPAPAAKPPAGAPARPTPGPGGNMMAPGGGMGPGGGMMGPGGGMMGPGGGMMGMGPGMMGMGGGMCPMMGGAGTKVDVKKIEKGVTITFTATDPAMITRLQKMAEGMRLMHEAMAQ